MHVPRWLPVAGLPVLTGAALLWLDASPGHWVGLTRAALWRVAADALLINASVLVIAAPMLGVLAGSRLMASSVAGPRSAAWTIARRLGVPVGVFVGGSAAVTVAGFGTTSSALSLVGTSHATLAAAALALAAMGALCGRRFRDPLDAVACSAFAAGLVSFGVLLAGPLVQHLPDAVINVALLASPLVATAAGAQIDILRTETFYQLSPIAHRRFDYPAWHVAAATYLIVTMLCFVALHRDSRRPPAGF